MPTADIIPFPHASASNEAPAKLIAALAELRGNLTLLQLIALQAEERGERLEIDDSMKALVDGITEMLRDATPAQLRVAERR